MKQAIRPFLRFLLIKAVISARTCFDDELVNSVFHISCSYVRALFFDIFCKGHRTKKLDKGIEPVQQDWMKALTQSIFGMDLNL